MIDYHCNSCGHDGQLPDDLSGQVGRCPLCDSFLRAPGQPTPEGTDRRLLLFEDPAGWFLPSHLRNAARHAYTPGFYKVLFVAWTGGFFVLLALLPLKLSPDNEAKYAAAAAWRERVLPALGLDPSGSPWVHLAWGAATLVVVWIGDRARRDRVLDVYDSCSGGEPDGDLVGFAGAGGIDVLFWGPFLAFWLVFGLFLATHALPTVRPVPLLRGPWTFVVAVAVAGHVLTVALARRLIRARFGARRPRQAPPRSAPPSPHTGRVYICRLSPDGRWVASGSDGVACLQDAATEQECAVFHGHTGAVVAVAFTPDARSLASGGLDDRVRLWSVPARSPAGALPVASPPHDLVFTPDQGLLVGAGHDGRIHVWQGGASRAIGDPGRALRWLAAGRGGLVAARRTSGVLEVRDIRTGQLLWSRPSGQGPVAFSPNGRLLAAGGEGRDRLVCLLLDARSGAELLIFPSAGGAGLRAIAFSADSDLLAAATGDGLLLVWSVATGVLLVRRPFAQPLEDLRFNPSRRELLVVDAGGEQRRPRSHVVALP